MRNIVLCYCRGDNIVRQIYCEGYLSAGKLTSLGSSLLQGNLGISPEFIFVDVVSSFSQETNVFLENPVSTHLFLGYPVTIGGNIRSKHQINAALKNSCERVIINTAFEDNIDDIRACVETHGGQAILPMLDIVESGDSASLVIRGAREATARTLSSTLEFINNLGIHEIMVRFVEQQGTNNTPSEGVLRALYRGWDGSLITTGGIISEFRDSDHFHVRSIKELK